MENLNNLNMTKKCEQEFNDVQYCCVAWRFILQALQPLRISSSKRGGSLCEASAAGWEATLMPHLLSMCFTLILSILARCDLIDSACPQVQVASCPGLDEHADGRTVLVKKREPIRHLVACHSDWAPSRKWIAADSLYG